jgi:hypothetical protein
MRRAGDLDRLWPLWAAVAWVGLPVAWPHLTDKPYFLPGASGLVRVGGPVLFTLIIWTIVLAVPRSRTETTVAAAGGFIVGWAFVLSYFPMFHNCAGTALVPLGAFLAINAKGFQRERREV